MLKGISRQIVEITDTGSPYFERAFLVVRGDAAPPDEAKLHRLAQKVVEQADTYAGLRRQRVRHGLRKGLFGLGCAGVGAAVTWLLERIIA